MNYTYAIRCALADILRWFANRIEPADCKVGGTSSDD